MLGVVVETGCTPAAGDALGISEPTFKIASAPSSRENGLKRQVDLAKLLARHASPFRQ